MQSLILPEYIKSNIFVHQLNHKLLDHDINFDLLISDINYKDLPIMTLSPENKPENSSLLEARKDATLISRQTLIILNELSIQFILPLINLSSA